MFELKKNKRLINSCLGQSLVEYMVLFAIVAVLSILSLSFLYSNVQESCQDAMHDATWEIYQ
ncbi:MAG: hypothetical protein JW714_01075 [Candidatus Omnitrophica bacterium]|nr:hypothetical protein [Candidatus Omnitrophota bacterium]